MTAETILTNAILVLLEKEKTLTEGAGAVGAAAVLVLAALLSSRTLIKGVGADLLRETAE